MNEFRKKYLGEFKPDNSFESLLEFVKHSDPRSVAQNLYNALHTVEARDKEIIELNKRIKELEQIASDSATEAFLTGAKDKLEEIKKMDNKNAASIKVFEYRFNTLAKSTAYDILNKHLKGGE